MVAEAQVDCVQRALRLLLPTITSRRASYLAACACFSGPDHGRKVVHLDLTDVMLPIQLAAPDDILMCMSSKSKRTVRCKPHQAYQGTVVGQQHTPPTFFHLVHGRQVVLLTSSSPVKGTKGCSRLLIEVADAVDAVNRMTRAVMSAQGLLLSPEAPPPSSASVKSEVSGMLDIKAAAIMPGVDQDKGCAIPVEQLKDAQLVTEGYCTAAAAGELQRSPSGTSWGTYAFPDLDPMHLDFPSVHTPESQEPFKSTPATYYVPDGTCDGLTAQVLAYMPAPEAMSGVSNRPDNSPAHMTPLASPLPPSELSRKHIVFHGPYEPAPIAPNPFAAYASSRTLQAAGSSTCSGSLSSSAASTPQHAQRSFGSLSAAGSLARHAIFGTGSGGSVTDTADGRMDSQMDRQSFGGWYQQQGFTVACPAQSEWDTAQSPFLRTNSSLEVPPCRLTWRAGVW